MNTKTNQPFLYFNFKNNDQQLEPVYFKNPITIITTDSISEILPCLNKIQKFVDDGYYAAGFLAYESAPAFNTDFSVQQNNQMPLLWFGIFVEPFKKELDRNQPFSIAKWQSTVSIKSYYQSIDKIHDYIKKHKTEQVNYTIRLRSQFKGDDFSFYKQIEEAQTSNYSAYINTTDHSIMSASPELFFKLKDGIITTKPMKGTIERGKTYEEDIKNAAWLKNSKKNRFENEIITDLIKQELETIAVPGTVSTPSQFNIEKYPTLYQMTSSVEARLAPNKNVVDIFKALFPSGSITGLPKRQTMDIITELETEPREIYCGAIGYMTPHQEAIFNVPIRTVLLDHKTQALEYGVGGGITIASTKEDEYNEVLTKATLLTEKRTSFQLLETLGIKNGEFIILNYHLDRLEKSANYFDFTLNLNDISNALTDLAKSHQDRHWKVRLLLNKDGSFTTEIDEIIASHIKKTVSLSKHPINKNERFLYHKTTNRTLYEKHKKNTPHVLDVLLWNDELEITEFTTGNIVVEYNGELITPPIECGLLPGTYRQSLLDEKVISERRIKRDDLKNAGRIWLINSVREWVLVDLDR